MKNYKILRCGDQDFWAYAFLAKEHIKYSKHDMEYVKYDKVRYNVDMLYIHSPDITNAHATTIPKLAHAKGVKVIGAYAGSPVFWSPAEKRIYDYTDLIVTISPQTYEFAKFHYKNHPIVFLPESVDTDVFYPSDRIRINKPGELIVGWAGGAHKKIKRTYLLDKLDFPVKIKSDWKQQRKDGVKTNTHMRDFYQSLDVLVVTSISECMPRVILEAMACGIPVISTDCGGIRMLIDKEFLVPINPEENCVEEINTRLHLLHKYPELRKAIGIRNRKWIEEQWSWTKNVTLWDDVFSLVIENKVDEAVKMADKFLDNYKEDFNYLRDKFRKIYFDTTKDTVRGLNKKEEKMLGFDTLKNNIKSSVLSPKQQALNDISTSNIPYWLLKNTCLDCVLYNGEKLTTNTISIGVDNVVDAIDMANDLQEQGFIIKQCTFKGKIVYYIQHEDIEIEIIIDPNRKTKPMALLDLQVLVPIPVLKYLKQTYGDDWENLK